jgi:chromosome segregation ATPase
LRGIADSRVDGIKIHKHLNAMNKQLLESNADLAREAEAWRDEVDRLKSRLRDADVEYEEVDVMGQLADRSHANLDQSVAMKARFASPGNSTGTPNRLERSMSAPTEGGHTAILQDMAEKLEILEENLAEKDHIIKELEQRLDAVGHDESSSNAQLKIDSLTAQLEEAENDRTDLHADFAQKTEQHAKRFGEICTGFEEQVNSLEGQLKFAQNEVERLRADKTRMDDLSSSATMDDKEKEWRRQVSGLEMDLSRAREECEARTDEADAARDTAKRAQEDRDELARQLGDCQNRIDELESMANAKDADADLEEEVENLRLDLAHVEEELANANRDLEELRQIDADKETELDQQHEQIELLSNKMRELEEQHAAEHQDDEEIQRLHDVIEEANAMLADKESELEGLRAKGDVLSLRQSTSSAGAADAETGVGNSFVVAMEERLDEAHREIGKLRQELAATPHRKSNIEMRDARIKALEREKAALADRLAAKEVSLQNGSLLNAGSPFKASPFVNKALASLKTPKTPGSLKEVSRRINVWGQADDQLSWLQSSVGDSNQPILRAQLEYLQDELKSANDQLDNNFSRLESAGFGALSLAEKLAKANERIADLEDELRGLSQRNKASLALVSAQRDEEK